MKNQRLLERKEELKQIAQRIKTRTNRWFEPTEFRFKHIAYCMARGRDYLQIEQKVHEHNIISEYKWKEINKDIEFLKEGWNEDVCVSA